MYWRIRKYGPVDVAKKYGIHIALVFSLLFNFLLIVTRPNLKKTLNVDVKQQMDQFARRVTGHVLDTSYISYETSTDFLLDRDNGELAPAVITAMRQQQLLPNDSAELRANVQTYTDQKRIVAVRVDKVEIGDPSSQGLIPVDVYGMVAVHSADEAGPPSSFHFQYLIGYRNGNTQMPIVAGFREISS